MRKRYKIYDLVLEGGGLGEDLVGVVAEEDLDLAEPRELVRHSDRRDGLVAF